MLWVVQENLDSENKRHDLLQALTRLEIPFFSVIVKNNTIEPEVEHAGLIITNGSIMLSNIAKARGWAPGSLINDNFSYDVWSEHYNEFLLNKNATISSLKDAQVISDKVFVRPILDNKTFNGKVFTKDEFLKFQNDSINCKLGSPRQDIQVLLSQPKTIGQEHRHYIVDGEVITSSRYKLAGQPNFANGCDDIVLDVVKEAIKLWQPAQAFVLDTYIAGDEIGIVEIGGICHAGLYEADIMKLVNALDTMELTLTTNITKKNKI